MAVTQATMTTPNRSIRSRPAASAPVMASAVMPIRYNVKSISLAPVSPFALLPP